MIGVVPGIVLLDALAAMALLFGVANKTAKAITSHTSQVVALTQHASAKTTRV